jgi:hypothetical protein
MDLDRVYPSIEEILPEVLLARVPASLASIITERYRTFGSKYVTQDTYNGRLVNSCMYKSSVQDALEEIVDATFNTLVWIFKLSDVDSWSGKGEYYDEAGMEAMAVLMGLIEIYSLLMSAKERQGINV